MVYYKAIEGHSSRSIKLIQFAILMESTKYFYKYNEMHMVISLPIRLEFL